MLSQAACWLHNLLLSNNQLLWWLFQFAVACVFITLVALLDVRNGGRRPLRGEALVLFLLSFVSLILLWLPNFPRPELNPDESQWIAQANNFAADPAFWLQYFLPSNLTRLLTILPLGVASSLLGGSIGYEVARLVGVAMWSGVATCYYVATRSTFGDRPALWGAALLVLTFGLFSLFDYVAYNSELPVVLLCMAGYALVIQAATKRGGIAAPMVAGVLIAAAPFAKEQGLPMAALLGLGAVGWFAYRREWKTAGALVAGALVWFAAMLLLLAVYGNVQEFLSLLATSRDYAAVGVSREDSGVVGMIRVAQDITTRTEMRFLIFSAIFAFGMLLFAWIFNRWAASRSQFWLLVWFVALFGASFFSVVYPMQRFPHYGLLLVVPCALVLGPLLQCIFDAVRPSALFIAAICLWLLLLPLSYQRGHDGVGMLGTNCGDAEENVFSAKIRELTLPGDRMLVWGWRNSYFVETGLLQGSRWMYPQFAVGPYSTAEDNLKRYAEDLDALKPKIILEWMGDDAFYSAGPHAAGIEQFPELRRRLVGNYDLVAVEGNQRLFLRRTAETVPDP